MRAQIVKRGQRDLPGMDRKSDLKELDAPSRERKTAAEGQREQTERREKRNAARAQAYLNEGWATPFDLIDDILENGIENVKARRDSIKGKLV